jgi:flagellar motor switch protein FliN/FliY
MSNVEHELDEPQAPLPGEEPVAVHPSALRELAADAGAAPEGAMGLGVLMDMPVKVTVEVGRVAITLGELCRLGAGALLKLDREAHQPADILVNGKVVARGEIVTVNESYGVRITDVSP